MPDNLGRVALHETLVALLTILIMPVVGASVLWLSAKLLRFRRPSFRRSVGCVVIALGTANAELAIFFAMSFDLARQPPVSPDAVMANIPIAAGAGVVAGVISVTLLFKESVWKSAMAIGLVLVGEVLWLGVSLVGVISLVFFEIATTVGPSGPSGPISFWDTVAMVLSSLRHVCCR